jgi:streptogramin lyase
LAPLLLGLTSGRIGPTQLSVSRVGLTGRYDGKLGAGHAQYQQRRHQAGEAAGEKCPPVPRQGARRVWSDSRGALWITGWNSGDLFRYDSKSKTWARWHLPGDGPQPYAVYVDEIDAVWVSDWGANAILRFDPKTEKFDSFPLPDRYAGVRQLAGRKGEVWGAESGADKLFVLKTE